MRCPPGGLFGPGEAQSTEFGGHGGSRRRGTPEHGVRAARGATDYTNRPKRKRGRRYSYRVLGQRGVVEEGVAGEVERSRPVGGGDAVENGRFPASWSHRLTPGDAAKVPRGQGRFRSRRRRGIGLRTTHLRGWLRVKSRRGGAWAPGQRAWEAPRDYGESTSGLWKFAVQRSGVLTAEQGRGETEQRGGGGARVCGEAAADGGAGGAARATYRATAALACGSWRLT